MRTNRLPYLILALGLSVIYLLPVPRAHGYVEAAHSFGQLVALSSHVCLMKVKSVDRVNNRIIYDKVRDIKGVHGQTEIRHNIGKAGFEAREWQTVMNWAEVGKEAVVMHNGTQSETCIGNYWYQAYGNHTDVNGWWNFIHGEPYLLRSYAGRIDKLCAAVTEVMAGKEVIVPCMVDGNLENLKAAKARVQRLRVSLKLANYDPKRDFVGWGGEDFRRVSGMPGFTHLSGVTRVDPDAQAISVVDFNGDGRLDLCLSGGSRVGLLQNTPESLNEVSLPPVSGVRSAVWADYNADGLPDLLLAAAAGPMLFTNTGKGTFRDDSHLLPPEAAYNVTCAAWIDADGDGRPDVLLGNGWHGLRLYRNVGKADGAPALAMGGWRHVGPFDNNDFNTPHVGANKIDLAKKHKGKHNEEHSWQESKFEDGKVNNLAIFRDNNNGCVYLYREIVSKEARKLPVSLGSDDGLVVWLNGTRLVSHNMQRACAPDQHKITLDLAPGKNELLMKVTQGGGGWEFYFNALEKVPPLVTWNFADVSDSVGLGAKGIGSDAKGDTLTVCDFDGDGRADVLYGSGDGMILKNTGKAFERVEASGVKYTTGKVGPAIGDYTGDGRPDVFVATADGVKLFRNDGAMKFTDTTKAAGLDVLPAGARCAAFGDLNNDGRVDLLVGYHRTHNRLLRNVGDGTFADESAKVGFHGRVFNTQAVAVTDINGDGVPDVVFNNEGQESVVLLGDPEKMAKRTPVSLTLNAKLGLIGSRLDVTDGAGKVLASHHVTGGDGRGGQAGPVARFALPEGSYKLRWRLSSGETRGRDFAVAATHLKATLDETLPKTE